MSDPGISSVYQFIACACETLHSLSKVLSPDTKVAGHVCARGVINFPLVLLYPKRRYGLACFHQESQSRENPFGIHLSSHGDLL
jgi:hypothetical protein